MVLYVWVIMSNHVHLIASAQTDYELSACMRDLKKYTSRQLIKAIEENIQESRKVWLLWLFKKAGQANSNNITYQFWQQDNHPVELRTNEMLEQRLTYLHHNPVNVGWVWEPQHYKYSSAIDYCSDVEKGLLPVARLC